MSDLTITKEMWDELMGRLERLEKTTAPLITFGPSPENKAESHLKRYRAVKKILEKPIPAVDRSAQVLVSGEPVPEDRNHTELKENGQQKDYVVLSAEERHKGFVRPVRRTYKHLKCGNITTMSQAIAETYARDPGFYSGTFCCTCGAHFPIETYGQTGEFVWIDDGTKVGS
jgi:hypothetical protein